jgi:hypothetical protein
MKAFAADLAKDGFALRQVQQQFMRFDLLH